MVVPVPVRFIAHDSTPGVVAPWKIESIAPVIGATLPRAAYLDIREGDAASTTPLDPISAWTLRGFTSNRRYTNAGERDALVAVQAGLGRVEATCAALIPIKKNEAWWELAQDERRKIFEDDSRHIALGMKTLPAVARRLYHSRDLSEPFDFLTWFELAPEAKSAFEDLVVVMRATEEWRYVEREVDVRLTRVG